VINAEKILDNVNIGTKSGTGSDYKYWTCHLSKNPPNNNPSQRNAHHRIIA